MFSGLRLPGNRMATDSNTPADSPLVMGRIARPYGVKGWLHVVTYTARPENLLEYLPWYLHRKGRWQATELAGGRCHGKGLVVQLAGCTEGTPYDAITSASSAKLATTMSG